MLIWELSGVARHVIARRGKIPRVGPVSGMLRLFRNRIFWFNWLDLEDIVGESVVINTLKKKCADWWYKSDLMSLKKMLPHATEKWFQIPRSGTTSSNTKEVKSKTMRLWRIPAYHAFVDSFHSYKHSEQKKQTNHRFCYRNCLCEI